MPERGRQEHVIPFRHVDVSVSFQKGSIGELRGNEIKPTCPPRLVPRRIQSQRHRVWERWKCNPNRWELISVGGGTKAWPSLRSLSVPGADFGGKREKSIHVSTCVCSGFQYLRSLKQRITNVSMRIGPVFGQREIIRGPESGTRIKISSHVDFGCKKKKLKKIMFLAADESKTFRSDGHKRYWVDRFKTCTLELL